MSVMRPAGDAVSDILSRERTPSSVLSASSASTSGTLDGAVKPLWMPATKVVASLIRYRAPRPGSNTCVRLERTLRRLSRAPEAGLLVRPTRVS